MEYVDLVDQLQDEIDALKRENERLWRILGSLQDYSDYLEATSQSTDDQPRPVPRGWGCIVS